MSHPALLTALGAILGLQSLRAFLPLLVYVLRDRIGLSAPALGALGVLVFGTSFLFPRLLRASDPLRGIAAALLALAVFRGALQLWVGEPIVSLILAALATVAFLAFLAAASRMQHAVAEPFLFGALLDASLHAVAGTRDLHWGGTLSDMLAWTILALSFFEALRTLRRGPGGGEDSGVEAHSSNDVAGPISRGVGLLAWGPYLFLHLEWFGNVARLSARASLPTGKSGSLLVLGLAAGLLLSRQLPRRGPWAKAPALLLASTFVAHDLVWGGVTGPLAFATLFWSQLAGATLLTLCLSGMSSVKLSRETALFGASCVLFFLFLFGHYAGYVLPMPVSRTALLLAASAFLLAVSLGVRQPKATPMRPFSARLAFSAAILVLLPLVRPMLVRVFVTQPSPRPGESSYREPLKVVSFNLHAGFDELGGFAFDRMLDALAHENADIVALQEVSRGWVINGSADLYELARERLEMPGVPGPSSSFDWGNALFTRWPSTSSRVVAMPPRELLLTRSVTVADLQGPEIGSLRIFATHYHHRVEDPEARAMHSRFLVSLAETDGRTSPAILLGDFNALPDSDALDILKKFGFRDAFDIADTTSLTYPSVQPVRRIDTIFLRGPLLLETAVVAPAWGSDHRAVVASVFPAGRMRVEGEVSPD